MAALDEALRGRRQIDGEPKDGGLELGLVDQRGEECTPREWREPAVGVEEEEPLAPSRLGPRVELETSPARRRDRPGSRRLRDRGRAVARPAIRHHDVERDHDAPQVVEQQREAGGFVERRDHDADHGWPAVSFSVQS